MLFQFPNSSTAMLMSFRQSFARYTILRLIQVKLTVHMKRTYAMLLLAKTKSDISPVSPRGHNGATERSP